jgi:diaminopimelate epimerase
MRLRFSKMHGLGNDFVVFDAVSQDVPLTPELVRKIADRRFGIGCDQVLLAEPARDLGVDFHYRIYNADGGEVAQCGNGARCLARFVLDQGLSDKQELIVSTALDTMRLVMRSDGQVRVNMGRPRLEPSNVPFKATVRAPRYRLLVADTEVEIGAVSMGNPHAVLQVGSVDVAPVETLGAAIEGHAAFPERVNVGFMEIVDRNHIQLRVFERGVGETLACGSGACAAVVCGRLQALLDDSVTVSLPGGDLEIHWSGGEQPVYLTGPAQHVFDGCIDL